MDRQTLRKLSLFEKTSFVRRLALDILGIDNDEAILRIVARLSHKAGYVRKYGGFSFSREEEIMGRILDEHKISSKTVYTWFLLARAPKNVLELYQKGEISQTQLIRMKERVPGLPRDRALAHEIIGEIRRLVEVL